MNIREDLEQHQLTAIEFIKKVKKCGLFMGMSIGKTVLSLTTMLDMLSTGTVNKVLIIAPKMVGKDTWTKEIIKWEHLKDLNFINLIDLTPAKREAKLKENAPIYIINKELVKWLYPRDNSWDMIIVDESTAFKSYKSICFLTLNKFTYNYMMLLTGTPHANTAIDLWSQIYLLDKGLRLGKNITAYRNSYFEKDWSGFKWILKKPAKVTMAKILDKIKDICLTMKTEDYVKLPPVKLIYRKIANPEPEMYEEFEAKYSVRNSEMQAYNIAMRDNKLMQFCNGFMYDENNVAIYIHDAKLHALDKIIKDNKDENILVAYNFKADLDYLQKRFSYGVKLEGDPSMISQWNQRKIKLMFAHPASCSMGLNLQFGGRTIVWYGVNWNMQNYVQFNARLHRLGQVGTTNIYHITIKNSIEDDILQGLKGKGKMNTYLFDYMKASRQKQIAQL